MAIRIAVNTLILHRNGKRVKVKPGEQIELTSEELASLKADAPDSIRIPHNEVAEAPKAKVPADGKGDAKAGGKPSGAAQTGSDEL